MRALRSNPRARSRAVRMRLCALCWLVAVLSFACGDDAGPESDGGLADAGAPDGAVPDAHVPPDGDASACDGGDCAPDDGCALGEEGCACAGGSCDPGLACHDDVCIDARGQEGAPCLPNNRCHSGNRCEPLQAVCVHCQRGTAGCQCGEGDGCAEGLACQANLCVDADTLPPAEPACYTPCRADVVTADGVRPCDSDGLLSGCLDGLSCTDGSCLPPGADKPSCDSDLECPFFQTCLAGGCYANCETHADCGPGRGCFAKVCRVACSSASDAAACPRGQSCDAQDGENGFCSPIADASGARGSLPEAGFVTSKGVISLSNVKTAGSFALRTDKGPTQAITVRKLRHRVWSEQGELSEVSAPIDPVTGEYRECDPARGECPLFWLTLALVDGDETQGPALQVSAPGDCEDLSLCPEVRIAGAGDGPGVRWEGELELCSQSACSQPVTVTYFERPDGQWSGTLHYFGTFEDDGLAEWLAQSDRTDARDVQNALIKKWAEFRRGGLSGGWEEFQAILTATREGSWQYETVEARCQARAGACYPYTNASGVRTYSDDLASTPIPTGQARFPIALNLRVESGGALRGRIASEVALQYAGNPDISLSFEGDPSDASACSVALSASGDCAVFLSSMTSDIVVGGRYYSEDGTCAAGYATRTTPWLVDGFTAGTVRDEATGLFYRHECLDDELPLDPKLDPSFAGVNVSLAGGNPIPDGRERERQLTLIDGALINQSTLFVLFQEAFETFIPGEPAIAGYGYMLLTRKPSDVEDAAFEGWTPPDTVKPAIQDGLSCSQAMLDRTSSGAVAGQLGLLAQADLDILVDELIEGADPSAQGLVDITARTHVLCEETGLIDGGKHNLEGAGPFVACPGWSKLTYFTSVPSAGLSQADIAGLPCNQKPNRTGAERDGFAAESAEHDDLSCFGWFQLQRDNGRIDHVDPVMDCSGGGELLSAFCDDPDRLDMLANKTFYARSAPSDAEPMLNILTVMDQAFRYKIRFQSDSGSRLGFAPRICLPDSDQVPYCYEPAVIEEIRARVDCLIELYTRHHTTLSNGQQTKLDAFLRQSFSTFARVAGEPVIDGFERLYAELLTMLGDEALTAAFSSRFDLSGSRGSAFEGSLFEDGGIDLTGVAGFELSKLYAAVQHYQLALDRLYAMGPNFRAALDRGASTDDTQVFVSPATVTDYLERLTRAATQKARAWGEIARRYQQYNRPDLARAVIERAYTATYLESVVLSNLMIGIKKKSVDRTLDQIRIEIERSQLRYRVALLDMRDIYEGITDSVTYFGFSPEYMPFPALDAGNVRDTNAYEVLALLAKQKVDIAKQREQAALDASRDQGVESETFQSQLVQVRNTYENQLAELCGTFVGDDQVVYPAITKYAHRSPQATLLGNPCGLMGNGGIHDALANLEIARVGIRSALTRYENILKEIAIETRRLTEQCSAIKTQADAEATSADAIIGIQDDIAQNRLLMGIGQRAFDTVTAATSVESPWLFAGVLLAGTANNTLQTIGEAEIADMEHRIAEKQRDVQRLATELQCTLASADSAAKVDTLMLGLDEAVLEGMRANLALGLQVSELDRLANSARRWEVQQKEAEQLLINVEAARNDPNVRIYRNDAVINADIAFEDAVRAVYRATRVFEYYTSQTYAKRDELFLIRMVTAGERNLENYVQDLDNAFYEFEEQFGVADTRVQVLSLKDDIMQIPLMDEQGNPLGRSERVALMRERLRDVRLLDGNGYLTIPFSTSLNALSPLTRNHKILYMEADIVGSDVGDTVGRVYLRSAGTGVIRNVGDGTDFYVFPERTAVLDTFFNGNRVYDPEVYRSHRMRDRPLVNTLWELVINQRDEQVNRDIDLQSLSDIRLLVYYTDFTAL